MVTRESIVGYLEKKYKRDLTLFEKARNNPELEVKACMSILKKSSCASNSDLYYGEMNIVVYYILKNDFVYARRLYHYLAIGFETIYSTPEARALSHKEGILHWVLINKKNKIQLQEDSLKFEAGLMSEEEIFHFNFLKNSVANGSENLLFCKKVYLMLSNQWRLIREYKFSEEWGLERKYPLHYALERNENAKYFIDGKDPMEEYLLLRERKDEQILQSLLKKNDWLALEETKFYIELFSSLLDSILLEKYERSRRSLSALKRNYEIRKKLPKGLCFELRMAFHENYYFAHTGKNIEERTKFAWNAITNVIKLTFFKDWNVIEDVLRIISDFNLMGERQNEFYRFFKTVVMAGKISLANFNRLKNLDVQCVTFDELGILTPEECHELIKDLPKKSIPCYGALPCPQLSESEEERLLVILDKSSPSPQ